MYRFSLVMLGMRDQAIFLQSLCNICLVIFVYVGYCGLGSVFWWVFAWELGGQALQLLTRSYGTYLIGYPNQRRWLFWVGWLMYYLPMNELLSPLLCYILQFLNSSIFLHLFCDDLKQCFAEFCLEFGKLVVCAAGSVVGSSVALIAGVQPWLIASDCASQFSPGSMMMPYLTETQLMFRMLVALTVMHSGFKAQNLFIFLLGFCFTRWHCGYPIELRHLLCIVQFQIVTAGICASYPFKHVWHQWPVAFLKETMIPIFYPFPCTSSIYGIITSYLPFYFCRMDIAVYVLYMPSLICAKYCYCIMMRKSIPHLSLYQVMIVSYGERIYKVFLPYDSKACSQHAFRLRLISASRTGWFIRTVFENLRGFFLNLSQI